ncbi:MAG TPA: M14 family zinc carboxypeptidase [bacterium]|nr:M14 family zinc carboxypeptidase [bacterium]
MRRLIPLLLIAALVFPAAAKTQLVRCYLTRELQQNVPWGTLDVAGWVWGVAADVLVDEADRDQLYYYGLTQQDVLIDDVEAATRAFWEEQANIPDPDQYHSYDQMLAMMQTLAADYPAICELHDLSTETGIGPTYDGMYLWGLKISDNVATDEPDEADVMFNGLHHAREITTHELVYRFAEYLCETYGMDATVTNIVDNREVWIVPIVNPDGYQYVRDYYYNWRKNRRDNGDGTWGVDNNRNYTYKWGYDDYGSDPDPSGITYRGPYPGSEPETQTMMHFYADRSDAGNPVVGAINFHTYAQLVLYPWGYIDDVTEHNYIYAPMADLFAGYNGYTAQPSYALYNTNGDACDWQYGSHLADGDGLLAEPLFGFTFEMGTQFQPPYSEVQVQFEENLPAMLDMCLLAQNPEMICPLPAPVIDAMDTDDDGDYTVSWTMPEYEHGVLEYYRLDEMTGYERTGDGAEEGLDNWDNVNFEQSASSPHEGSYCFWSGDGDGYSARMTSLGPLTVAPGDELTYWARYNIETGYDYAYVEASADGVVWDRLRMFTGYLANWTEYTHSLDDYADGSCYLRFRYVTDTYTHSGGIYFDDIYPVDTYAVITTLGDDLTETSFDVEGRDPDTYYYRVRGGNDFSWGAWSAVEDVDVMQSSALVADFHYDDASDGILLSWTPGEGYAGANLLRERDDARVRLNERLLPAEASHWLVTDPALDDRYYLEVVDSYGETVTFGPLTIHELPGGYVRTVLDAPYPNPARESATLSYSISPADAGKALEISVYDLSGRRVETLAQGVATGGSHLVVWNVTSAGAGVYFVRLSVGEERQTTRLVIAR